MWIGQDNKVQQVHEGRLANGQRGLFTNGWLVVKLQEDDDAKQVADRIGMEFIVR